jgi:hypothetical protein
LPAVVLSPNSAIQAQWADKIDFAVAETGQSVVSTDPERPGLLTSLTYQSVRCPAGATRTTRHRRSICGRTS